MKCTLSPPPKPRKPQDLPSLLCRYVLSWPKDQPLPHPQQHINPRDPLRPLHRRYPPLVKPACGRELVCTKSNYREKEPSQRSSLSSDPSPTAKIVVLCVRSGDKSSQSTDPPNARQPHPLLPRRRQRRLRPLPGPLARTPRRLGIRELVSIREILYWSTRCCIA